MASDDSLPNIGECATLFHQVCRTFTDEWFTVEELCKLLRQEKNDERSHEANDLDDFLDLLVAYGLLQRDAKHRYRIRCRPGESATEWHANVEPQIEAIHRHIHTSERSGRTLVTSDKPKDVIPHKEETYLGIFIGEDTEFQELVTVLTELLKQDLDRASIVLRSNANEAATLQGIADRLHDPDVMAEKGCPYRFEKEDTEVVGEHKDDLEYRLFLTAESL